MEFFLFTNKPSLVFQVSDLQYFCAHILSAFHVSSCASRCGLPSDWVPHGFRQSAVYLHSLDTDTGALVRHHVRHLSKQTTEAARSGSHNGGRLDVLCHNGGTAPFWYQQLFHYQVKLAILSWRQWKL
jgi:hypothetical protein